MKRLRNATVVLLLLLFGVTALAADRIELIPLKNRSAEELIPLLRPMLNQDEALSGSGFQLILRATPERHAELKGLVTQLDAAARQVRISVRRASQEEIDRERAQARVAVGVAGDKIEARGRAIVRSTQDRGSERNHFEVTALENTPAYIHTGEAFPTPVQSGQVVNGQVVITQGIEYQQLSSGFYALARTQGDQVTVDISPEREVLDPRRAGHIQTTSLVTTVRGRLGDWMELGGTRQESSGQGGGLLRSTRSRDQFGQTLWLKVEALD